jgi:hypothetical protein
MPIFREATPEARQRLVKQSKGYQQRAVYRENLAGLSGGTNLEIQPEGDESLRKLKVNVRRAANELNLSVGYGETTDGTLLVWREAPAEKKAPRGRPRKEPAGA